MPTDPAEAERHLAELLDALRSRIEIRRMARNPVMLTALAVVHWNEKRLPEQRADLYESIITWLSRARMQRPGRPTPERCVGLLQDLALAMQDHAEGRQMQVPRHWAAETLAPYWRELPEAQRLDAARRFLADEELDSGIIVGRGDYVRYWHLTFQEYLAARALAARSEAEQQTVLLAQPKLYAAEWKEVVLLMAGVLYHQGIKRVDRMISIVLDQLGRSPQLADQAMCVGVLGAAVRDLAPMKYEPGDRRYRQLLTDVMRIFEPDWLAVAQRRHGGLWSRLVGIVSAQRSQAALIRLAIQAADVLGQAGVAHYAPGDLDKAWVTIPAGTFWMGAQKTEPDGTELRRDARADSDWNESPVHEVELDAFRIARYPVTVGQYQRFVDAGGYARPAVVGSRRVRGLSGTRSLGRTTAISGPARRRRQLVRSRRLRRLGSMSAADRSRMGTRGAGHGRTKVPLGQRTGRRVQIELRVEATANQRRPPNAGWHLPAGGDSGRHLRHGGQRVGVVCGLVRRVPGREGGRPPGSGSRHGPGRPGRVLEVRARGCRAASRDRDGPQYRGDDLGFRLAAVHPR